MRVRRRGMADAWRVRDGSDLNACAGSGTGHAVIELSLEKTGGRDRRVDRLWGRTVAGTVGGEFRLPPGSAAPEPGEHLRARQAGGDPLGDGGVDPRTPTHVVISKADIIETPGDPLSVIETFAPGVTVHVVEQADAWVRIAVNGARIGWVETARLAVLQ